MKVMVMFLQECKDPNNQMTTEGQEINIFRITTKITQTEVLLLPDQTISNKMIAQDLEMTKNNLTKEFQDAIIATKLVILVVNVGLNNNQIHQILKLALIVVNKVIHRMFVDLKRDR